MEQNKIIEGNKLIAEFMGLTFIPADEFVKCFEEGVPVDKKDVWLAPPTKCGTINQIDKLEYHTNWNWLMPVVEKIESLGYDFSIDNCYVRIWDGGQSDFEMTFSEPTKLLTAYFAVIEFIKWYNNERK